MAGLESSRRELSEKVLLFDFLASSSLWSNRPLKIGPGGVVVRYATSSECYREGGGGRRGLQADSHRLTYGKEKGR